MNSFIVILGMFFGLSAVISLVFKKVKQNPIIIYVLMGIGLSFFKHSIHIPEEVISYHN